MSDQRLDLTTATLKQLEDAGLVASFEVEVTDLFVQLREIKGDKSLLQTIGEDFPECITAAGEAALEQFAEDGRPEIILEGVQERSPDEKPATSKQIGFLRRRFRIDEKALAALSEWQARAAIKHIVQTLANVERRRSSRVRETDPMVQEFLRRTYTTGVSKYGLWTELDDMPFPMIQGPFHKSEFLNRLALHLKNINRIIFIARDGKLVDEAERAGLLAEAAEIIADYVSGRGPLAQTF